MRHGNRSCTLNCVATYEVIPYEMSALHEVKARGDIVFSRTCTNL